MHLFLLVIHRNIARAGHAALAHAASHYSSVAGHASARGQDSGSHFHAVNVFRSGFTAHQDHWISLGASASLDYSIVGGKHNLPYRSTR